MAKRTKPTKQKKIRQMPGWIRSNDYRLINATEKHFLGYLYRFKPNQRPLRNSQLAEKFYVTRTTIQRWLRKLRRLELIRIENPHGADRLIHTTGTGRTAE